MSFYKKLYSIPKGTQKVIVDNQIYLLTKTQPLPNIFKVYAHSVSGNDYISFNYYITSKKDYLKPCEMSEQKVRNFIHNLAFVKEK